MRLLHVTTLPRTGGQEKASAIQAKQRGPVIGWIVRLMRNYGITVEALSDAIGKRTSSLPKTRGLPAAVMVGCSALL